jgi:hypothetical protein
MSNDIQKSNRGTVLGGLSLIAWLLPVVGLPVAILGIRASAVNNDDVGSALSVIGLILTIINAIAGAVMFS